MAVTKRKSEESTLQTQCVTWFRLQYPKLMMVAFPNGAKLFGDSEQRAKQWNRLKSEGAVPGASDLVLFYKSGEHGALFIEMKTKTGRQSDTQKEFEQKVIEFGYAYCMPRSFTEFQNIINSYVKTGEF